jgi:hypothetical protein
MNISNLSNLSLSELRSLNEAVVEMIKLKRNMEASIKKVELSIGMRVRVNHPKLMGRELEIKKISRTKATLGVIGGFGSYNVPITMIEY